MDPQSICKKVCQLEMVKAGLVDCGLGVLLFGPDPEL